MTQTATALGLERSHLYRKMKSLESPLLIKISRIIGFASLRLLSLFRETPNSYRIRPPVLHTSNNDWNSGSHPDALCLPPLHSLKF